ncbi:MAG: septation protein IspZ [Deltaproteobacteria bacterium]|nr:septation protein IspZ [Deltaproteobacteria bacterium]
MSAPTLRKVGIELAVTIGIPTLLLWYATDVIGAGPTLALALAFPLGWLLVGVARTRKVDKLALVALVGIAITGGTSLLQLDPKWIALKEGMVPALIALAMLASCLTSAPVLAALLDPVLDRPAVDAAIARHDAADGWRRALLKGTVELAVILLLSGVVSAVLAWWILDAAPGTPEFNSQLGKVNTVGLFAVNLPVAGLATWRLSRVLERLEVLTGLTMEQLVPAASERSK